MRFDFLYLDLYSQLSCSRSQLIILVKSEKRIDEDDSVYQYISLCLEGVLSITLWIGILAIGIL